MPNSISLITDNEQTETEVRAKILLLRNSDAFESIRHDYCFEKVKESQPAIVFYHYIEGNEEKLLNFLQKVNQTKSLQTTPVILLFEEFDENILCSAFEKGITDFLTVDATETEFTIRTLWSLKKREKIYESENNKDILSQLKIIDKTNHVYTENYTYTILKEESKNNWGTFVVVAPDINVRSKISPQTLMNTIKNTVRSCDILGYASDFKIYLWFRKTEAQKAAKVLEKIRQALSKDFTICAGYIDTKNLEFDKAEEYANKALSKALLKGSTFIHAQEQKKKEVNLEINIKNFKAQKENLSKQLDSILSPLFYRTQKIYEEKLFQTKIIQNVANGKGLFKLENEKGQSTITVSYPGYTKINIEIIHNITGEDLKAEKLHVEAQELDEKKLEYLLNSFIKDFQNYTQN